MGTRQIFPVRLTEEEKEAWKKFSDDYTNGKIAELIREAVKVVMRNPTLLDPTEETVKLLKDLEQGYKLDSEWQDTIEKALHQQNKRMETIEKKVDLLLAKQSVSQKEIKEALGENTLGELVFDE